MSSDKSTWRRAVAIGALMVVPVFFVASCSLPQAQADPTRFYVLSALPVPAVAATAGKLPTMHLRPVELASYIKAKPMIVRLGANEIEFREYARWGEPLELGIARVLREELLASGAAGAVVASGMRAFNVDYDYELTVRVPACEGTANGGVLFRAVWELSTTGDNPRVAAHGDFQADGLKWDGKNEAELAGQLSKAVSELSSAIAAGLAPVK